MASGKLRLRDDDPGEAEGEVTASMIEARAGDAEAPEQAPSSVEEVSPSARLATRMAMGLGVEVSIDSLTGEIVIYSGELTQSRAGPPSRLGCPGPPQPPRHPGAGRELQPCGEAAASRLRSVRADLDRRCVARDLGGAIAGEHG